MLMTSILSDEDVYLFNEGTHVRLYEKLGAHPCHSETARYSFAVWAPNADRVSVVGDFNGWSKDRHPLKTLGNSGIWEGCVREAASGSRYKYHIVSKFGGYEVDKADPFAFHAEIPLADGLDRLEPRLRLARRRLDGHSRQAAIARRAGVDLRNAFRLVDALRRTSERILSYRDIAPKLAEYRPAARLHARRVPAADGASVLRFLGLSDDAAISPRPAATGSPQDLMYLIDYLHQHGIGVDSRLGSFALHDRRAWPRLFRRHASVRTRRSAARIASRSGAATCSTTAATKSAPSC